ncbi:MAG: IS630 family transposase [Methanobacteriales archaeon Met13]
MTREKSYVKKHLSVEELDQKIRGLKQDVRVLKKLLFIKNRYQDESVEKSANLVGATKATGYNWLRTWNKDGYDGLQPKPKSGRRSRLFDEDKKKLESMLREKDSWITREVQDLVKREFGVEYSSWQIRRIIKSFGMKHAKPLQK